MCNVRYEIIYWNNLIFKIIIRKIAINYAFESLSVYFLIFISTLFLFYIFIQLLESKKRKKKDISVLQLLLEWKIIMISFFRERIVLFNCIKLMQKFVPFLDSIALQNRSVIYFTRVKFWCCLTEGISASTWKKNCVIYICYSHISFFAKHSCLFGNKKV